MERPSSISLHPSFTLMVFQSFSSCENNLVKISKKLSIVHMLANVMCFPLCTASTTLPCHTNISLHPSFTLMVFQSFSSCENNLVKISKKLSIVHMLANVMCFPLCTASTTLPCHTNISLHPSFTLMVFRSVSLCEIILSANKWCWLYSLERVFVFSDFNLYPDLFFLKFSKGTCIFFPLLSSSKKDHLLALTTIILTKFPPNTKGIEKESRPNILPRWKLWTFFLLLCTFVSLLFLYICHFHILYRCDVILLL